MSAMTAATRMMISTTQPPAAMAAIKPLTAAAIAFAAAAAALASALAAVTAAFTATFVA